MNKLTYIKQKIASNIENVVTQWKTNNNSIVFTNGCFDILHRGHIEYLAQTADLADKFIVGVNADESVKSLQKGNSRPLQDEYSRALIIASLSFVDAVVIFTENTPYHLIKKIIPDVLVKGGDYDANISDKTHPKYIVGSDVVHQNGGKVEVIPFVKGYSTSNIEMKIKQSV